MTTDRNESGHTPESVFAALAAGHAGLDDEQLAVLSDLDAVNAARLIASFAGFDATARFVLLNELVEGERGSRLLDFSAIYRRALRDEDPAVRAVVIGGLATCEAAEIVPDLLEAAHSDPDETVRSEAAIALGSFALRAELGELRPSLARQVIDTLRALADDSTEDPTVRAAAIAGLGVVNESWVQDLIFDAYESGDPALRIGALQAMGGTADEYWLPTIVNAMDSSDSDERFAAARAAGGISNEDAIIPLGELLQDEALDVVEAAAAALGEIGGPIAADQLDGYASHPDPVVRGAIQVGINIASFADDPLGLAGKSGPFLPPLGGDEADLFDD